MISKINSLCISNFRNHQIFSIKPQKRVIVLTGKNGSGKTSILESISLISAGKSLRNAKYSEITKHNSIAPWHCQFTLAGEFGEDLLEITTDHKPTRAKKIIKLNDQNLKKSIKLSDYASVAWFCPQIACLFNLGSVAKRKFFDNLISKFESTHANNLQKNEYFLRERLKILRMPKLDSTWIDVVERKISELSAAITVSRSNFVEFINLVLAAIQVQLPKPKIKIKCEYADNLCQKSHSSAILEKIFFADLQKNRDIDAKSGRTNQGANRANFAVIYQDKLIEAEFCSTGEQKSLLLYLFIAEIEAHRRWYGNIPIILLDDIFSHIDESGRSIIMSYAQQIGAQVWISTPEFDVKNNDDEFEIFTFK